MRIVFVYCDKRLHMESFCRSSMRNDIKFASFLKTSSFTFYCSVNNLMPPPQKKKKKKRQRNFWDGGMSPLLEIPAEALD